MQNAKDTFLETLRSRLAALNPNRTVVVRGAVRPAILAEANELPADAPIADCFRLRWVKTSVDANGALPLATMQCDIAYETAGTALNAGMDRGRMLTALDAELAMIVNAAPQRALKHDYSTAADLSTTLWWSTVEYGSVTEKADRLARVATVTVMSYTEGGEQ